MKMVDDTPLKTNSVRQLLHELRKKLNECEDLHIDFEPYVDKSCLAIVIEQLECCVKHKDKLQEL